MENRSRHYVEARVRAGVLEQGTVDLLVNSGVGDRLQREGLKHGGIYLQWPGERHRIDFKGLTGKSVWVYGQTEVVKDLIAARTATGDALHFEVSDTAIRDVETERPVLSSTTADGIHNDVTCGIVVGADGFHGVSRPSIPKPLLRTWDRTYPYAWLGIPAEVPPSTDEFIYAWHPRGFAMHSMRSHEVSRLCLQVDPSEQLDAWPDDRIWEELQERLGLDGWTLATGRLIDRSITPMRSCVSTPMRHGRLLLAGDAAHIVPPTGSKGLNLAVADIAVLADALVTYFAEGREEEMDRYEKRALELTPSRAAATSLAENYVGLPLAQTSSGP